EQRQQRRLLPGWFVWGRRLRVRELVEPVGQRRTPIGEALGIAQRDLGKGAAKVVRIATARREQVPERRLIGVGDGHPPGRRPVREQALVLRGVRPKERAVDALPGRRRPRDDLANLVPLL